MAQDAVALIKADRRWSSCSGSSRRRATALQDQAAAGLPDRPGARGPREIEEEIYYPAVEAKAKKDGKELVAEAVEEHHVVKVLLGELAGDVGRGRGLRRQGHGADGERRHHPRRRKRRCSRSPRRSSATRSGPPGRGDGGPQAAARRRLTPGLAVHLPFTLLPGEREVDGDRTGRAGASGSTAS